MFCEHNEAQANCMTAGKTAPFVIRHFPAVLIISPAVGKEQAGQTQRWRNGRRTFSGMKKKR